MGCHTDGNLCDGVRFGTSNGNNHCGARVPSSASNRAKLHIVASYPTVDQGNVKQATRNALMYGSSIISSASDMSYTSPSGASATNPAACGKISIPYACGFSRGDSVLSFDYRPNELSFEEMDSDTWFCYVWDMGSNGGTIGSPCYYIRSETRSTTGGTDPVTGQPLSSSSAGGTTCVPCATTCTPTGSIASYDSPTGDETGDADCPYPTVYAFGTTSTKILISYDQLSTELPNGVTDINFVYAPDNIDADVWDQETYSGDPIETSHNIWREEDESFSTFVIYEGAALESGNKQGLRVKVKIEPILDNTAATPTFTGTRWELQEVLNAGQNYAVNDTFTLEYTHLHEDLTTSTISITLKVTAVGPVNTISGQSGFDVLSEGDTLNGHSITNTFHSDLDNFLYHVIYVDGEGADFAKDTQYTSSRNHVVTVHAGYGIVDRACFMGLYEFTDKSIQFTTHSIDSGSPDVYNTVKQPDVSVTITNGRVSGTTINDGGAGWDTVDQKLNLEITSPLTESGRVAEIEGIFTSGVLTNIKIIDGGSGYSSSDPPSIWVRNRYKVLDTEVFAGVDPNDVGIDEFYEQLRNTGHFPDYSDAIFNDPESIKADNTRREGYEAKTQGIVQSNVEVLLDPAADRILPLPQRAFREGEVAKLRDTYESYEYPILDELEISDVYLNAQIDSRNTLDADVEQSFQNITQKRVPDFARYKELKIEAVQRRFQDLPDASLYTKYMVTQYRADTRQEIKFNVTIGCSVSESGCSHITCSPPGGVTSPPETDPNTGATSTYSYTISALLGPGCADWTASGDILIRNNMTRAANTYGDAVEAYGNPFDT